MKKRLKIGFLGAGYIAKWHADALRRVPGAELGGVCDRARGAAERFSAATGAPVFSSLEAMLGQGLDCIHVLTPPDAHFEATRTILSAGVAAFVEKPFVLSGAEAGELVELAASKKAALGVNHNFLMLPGYERLKRDIAAGVIGPIDSFEANWRLPLAPLRAGPYGLWMLRAPQNILYEIGPHLFAFVADLFGAFEVESALLRYPIAIPGGMTHYQGWRFAGLAGQTAVTLDLSLIEGHEDRSIAARGLGASAAFNFAEDVYTLKKASMGDIVAGPMMGQAGLAAQAARAGAVNAARQLSSLNALAPYGLSITRACRSFCAALAEGRPVDRRLSGALARDVAHMMDAAAARAAPKLKASPKLQGPMKPVSGEAPSMLVIGGSGFIGRALVSALADAGHGVRVLSRGKATGFDRADGRVEVFAGDLKSAPDLAAAMKGVAGVFHLARAEEKTWAGYLENDVAVTRAIGEAALAAGVRRLVYTGTIASYDASLADRPITEETPFEDDMSDRELYARSKAACEAALRALESRGLPLVIVRPGIVIGRGGPLQHWGVAMWRGATAAKLWGRGDNILPFVLLDDVADGLVRAMTTPGVEGRSFNLIGEPMLSGRAYFDEISRACGVRMRATPTPIWSYYATDVAKYWMKRLLQRRKDLARPSYRDWMSRAALSPFDNRAAKAALGWKPEADRAAFVRRAIVEADLFGAAGVAAASPARDPGADAKLKSAAAPDTRSRANALPELS